MKKRKVLIIVLIALVLLCICCVGSILLLKNRINPNGNITQTDVINFFSNIQAPSNPDQNTTTDCSKSNNTVDIDNATINYSNCFTESETNSNNVRFIHIKTTAKLGEGKGARIQIYYHLSNLSYFKEDGKYCTIYGQQLVDQLKPTIPSIVNLGSELTTLNGHPDCVYNMEELIDGITYEFISHYVQTTGGYIDVTYYAIKGTPEEQAMIDIINNMVVK